MIYPQITVKPNLGKDFGLEAGSTRKSQRQARDPEPNGTSINAYAMASGYGASLAIEYTLTNINDSNTGNQDMVLYMRLWYNAGIVAPTAYFVVDNLAGTNTKAIGTFTNDSTPNATLMIELPISATKDLVIDPFFSYAVSGYNLMEYYAQGYSVAQVAGFP